MQMHGFSLWPSDPTLLNYQVVFSNRLILPSLWNNIVITVLGTAVNHEFGEVEETAILVTFDEMYHEKKLRHVESYMRELLARFQARFPNLGGSFKEVMLSRMNKRRSSSRSRWDKKKSEEE